MAIADQAPAKEAHKLSVLYCSTEASHLSDLRGSIGLAAEERGIQLELSVTEVDFGQTPGIDIRDSAAQTTYLHAVSAGQYDAVLLSPPFQSFARSAFSRRGGRTPCRDLAWPRGFPWLAGVNKALVMFENAIIEFVIRLILLAAHARHLVPWRKTRIWLDHPEDRGTNSLGTPSSIWQFGEINHLA